MVEPKWPVVDLYDRRDTSLKVDQMKDIIKQLAIHIDPSLLPKEEKEQPKGIIGSAVNAVSSVLGFSKKKEEEKKDDT